MADNLRPDHKNADFLMRLLDEFEGNPHTSAEQNPKQDSVSVEAKEHSTHCEEAPSCRQLLSPADVNEFLRLWTGQFSCPSTGDCPRLSMWLSILF